MARSPDLEEFHDLTLFDRSPAELVDRAVSDAATKLPGWVPREGNTEVVLIEALALLVAETVFAINRVPSATIEGAVRLFGIEQLPGVEPTADIRFNLSDALGHEVPIGTTVRLDLGTDADPVDFVLTAGVVVAAGQNTGVAPARATRATSAANGVAVNTAVLVLDPLPFVNSAQLSTSPAGGSDPETRAEWLDRAVTRFTRLTDALVLPEHFTARALDNASVFRATTIDRWNVNAAANGHVTTAVLGDAGALLSAATRTAVEDDLETLALANLDTHVIDPTITAVNVTVTVRRIRGVTDAEVVASVTEALDAYLAPETWEWSGTVRRNELIALVDGVEGVDYVENLTAPAADVALAGVAPLANAGTLTVTVTAP